MNFIVASFFFAGRFQWCTQKNPVAVADRVSCRDPLIKRINSMDNTVDELYFLSRGACQCGMHLHTGSQQRCQLLAVAYWYCQ